MATLIFDVETVGEEWDGLDATTQSTLLRWVARSARTPEEYVVLERDIRQGLGFSPLTGFVVAIGVYDLERSKGVVYFQGSGDKNEMTVGEFTYKERSEALMLAEFWEGARHYDTFVTFNGRGFDVPFLVHRSVASGVKPTRNLMEGRYPSQQRSCRHFDLQDELTFYGAMSRRPSLHLFCRAYGTESPKGEVSGDEVSDLYKQGKYQTIAEYNQRDVMATTNLYVKWQEHIRHLGDESETINF
jgi:3'-5' exonuclease